MGELEGSNFLEAEKVEYYSDENINKAILQAKENLELIFQDDLQQIEYLKLRQIAFEIQKEKNMATQDIGARPLRMEIVARFARDNYGVDISEAQDIAGDVNKTYEYLRILRKRYLENEE